MRKNTILLYSSLLFSSFSSIALEQSLPNTPIYFEIGTGVSMNSGKESNLTDLNSSDSKFKNKSSVPISASIGYRYSSNLRWDINLTYLPEYNVHLSGVDSESDKIDLKSSVSSLSTSINGYYDFHNLTEYGITPYITAGIGLSINKTSDTDYYINDLLTAKYSGSSSNNLLWKIGLGAAHKINDNLFIDLSYRFVSLGQAKSKYGHQLDEDSTFLKTTETLKFKDLYSHQIMLGIGFNF